MAGKRLDDLRGLFERGPEQARRAMQSLLEGPLTFTPIETPERRRYHVQGRVSVTPTEVIVWRVVRYTSM